MKNQKTLLICLLSLFISANFACKKPEIPEPNVSPSNWDGSYDSLPTVNHDKLLGSK